MILCVSCGSTTEYRPKVLAHDYKTMELVLPNKEGRIYCGDPEFQDYASVSLENLSKIALALKHAKLPWHIRKLLEKDIKEFIKEIEQF